MNWFGRAGRRSLPPAPKAGKVERDLLVSNTGVLVVGRYVTAVLAWGGTLLIVRSMSVSRWGRFSFVFSLLGLLTIVTDLSLGRVAIGGVLDDNVDRAEFVGTYVALRFVLGLVGYALALGFVIAGNYPTDVIRVTAVAGLVVVVATMSNAIEIVFQATLNLRPVAVASVLGQTAQFALTAAIVVAHGSLVALAIPAVVCEIVAVSWKLARLRPILRPRYRVVWVTWKHLLRDAVPLAIGGAMATVYYRIDSVMLSRLDTFASVGIYGIAYKFVDLVHYLPMALMAPLLAILVRSWPSSTDEFRGAVRRSFLIVTAMGTFMVFEFGLFARPVIALLYGHRYTVGASAARLVMTGEFAHFYSILGVTILIAVGRNRVYPVVTLAGVVVNVALNLWLIPGYSYRGAAIATLVTEVPLALALWFALRDVPGVRPLPAADAAHILGAGVLGAVVAAGIWQVGPWPLAASAGAGVFALVVAPLRLWRSRFDERNGPGDGAVL